MQNPTFGFGASGTQPATTSLFGTTSTNTSAGGLFGTQSAPTFGTGGGLFSNTANTSTTTATLFGTPTSTPSFGTTTNVGGFSSAQPTVANINAAPTTTSTFGSAVSSAPAFGSTFATATTSSFGTIGTPAPSFGTASTAAATPTFGNTLTATSSLPVTTSTPSFGNFTTTTAAPSFGATSTATPLFGSAATSSAAAPSTGLGFNLSATTSAPTTSSVGLGGLATTQTKIVTTQKDVTPKDQPLPNEIHQTVESFKEFVKQQKIHSSDIAKCSIRDFRKVEQDIIQLTTLLSEVESQLQKNRQIAENLKYDTARCLKDVEIAQRTQDTPPGLQYENIAPLKFFLNLADKFEREMQVLKIQIEGADNYVKNHKSSNPLTPQDLAVGMRRLHESFVALAGRLHSVHSQVESQKEAYLQTTRQLYNDNSNPFDSLYKPEESFKHILSYSPPKVATGPTPFTNLAIGNTQLLASQQNQSTIAYPTPTTTSSGFGGVGFGTNFGAQPAANATQLFGSSSLAQNSSSFQLQKPPTGNKRGKQ
ncbi:nuclear pore complex protein Nup58 [Diorhabda carinulata]|uniref:nuclear pore complex protein Nup58 n=1 Tax=Diorhabda carinulata TaxID=1163345 RepID=UPI0025A28DD4|nr:nuclear pore complex protein Nup58 [Diorhabda carinulata]